MPNELRQTRETWVLWPLAVLLFALAVFLVSAHYVKAYSDPYLWMWTADNWLRGIPMGRWAPGYPVFLAACLKLVGRSLVFLVNTPLLLALAGLVCLLSAQLAATRRDDARPDSAALSGLLAAALFAVMNPGHLLELQNPYREALAFVLLLSGLCLLFSLYRRGGFWRAALAAVFIGLATAVRETCALLVLPAGLLLLYNAWRTRSARWAGGLAAFAGMLALGLLPILLHNHAVTGRFWIPSYAVEKWLAVFGGDSGGRFHIPIPGMDLGNFLPTGERLLAALAARYSAGGIVLFATGLVVAARRRNAAVFVFVLPALLVNLLFYSFWYTVSWRLSFVMDLFAIPVMAMGGAAVLEALARRRLLLRGAAWCVTAWAAFVVLRDAGANGDRLKVWQISRLQAYLQPQLRQPAALTVPNHASQMLCWLLDLPYAEMTLAFYAVDATGGRFEDVLAAAGRTNISLAAAGNVYGYGPDLPPILSQWFEFLPEVSLDKAPVPLEVYGQPLTAPLFRIAPWRTTEVHRVVAAPDSGGDYLLTVDGLRLWDYPGRTWCRLSVNGQTISDSLSNGVSFFAVSRSLERNDDLDIRISSDAPLPADPLIEVQPFNSDVHLPFGFRTNGWNYSLLPSGFTATYPWGQDGFLLFDEGDMRLPKLGDAAREYFAEFSLVSHVADGRAVFLTISSRWDTVRCALPAGSADQRATIGLGPATGALEWTWLRWTLDSSNRTAREAAIKVLDANLRALPFRPSRRLAVDVGATGDENYLLDGFYRPERHRQKTSVRWTATRCLVRAPVRKTEAPLTFTVRCFAVRPPNRPALPRFTVNGWPIPENEIRIADLRERVEEYRFSVPPSRVREGASQVLEIASEPWVPAEGGTHRDTRRLGLLVDAIEVGP